MATSRNTENAYARIEKMVVEKIITLENENVQLRSELAYANAKLNVYERISTISDNKGQIGFGPPIEKE